MLTKQSRDLTFDDAGEQTEERFVDASEQDSQHSRAPNRCTFTPRTSS
jgi:hypothetical protein